MFVAAATVVDLVAAALVHPFPLSPFSPTCRLIEKVCVFVVGRLLLSLLLFVIAVVVGLLLSLSSLLLVVVAGRS